MAGKTKDMSQIKQLLLLHQHGKGIKEMARTLGMSKNTVKRYLQKLSGLQPEAGDDGVINALLKLEAPILEAKFHAGNPAYKQEAERYADLQARMPYLLKELEQKGVTRYLLWQEYLADYPQGYSYSQFCFHLQQHRNATKPSLVLEHLPGDKLHIDFSGKTLSYIDRDTGEVQDCQVFVACLPYSNYSFVLAVPTQQTPDFLYAIEQCLLALGGAPAAIVPDNLKAAVIKTSRYEPVIQKALADFATHYNTTVVPTRPAKPQDKASVENEVNLMYQRVKAHLRHQLFFSLDALNKAIAEKVRAHNQTRMQQKPYCREERFLADEQKHLQPLPQDRFELKYYRKLTVHKNNHIYLAENKHYYSVPYTLISKAVQVIYTRTMVRIYHAGTQVAVHIRSYQEGTYTTAKEHLCSHHQHYLDRSPTYYLKKGQKYSGALCDLMEALFQQPDKHPEQLYRTCDGLLYLAGKSDKAGFEKACRTAIDHAIYSYTFIKEFLANHMENDADSQLPVKPLPPHDNIRGKAYYDNL